MELKKTVVPSKRLPNNPFNRNNNINLEQFPATRQNIFKDIYRKLNVVNNAKYILAEKDNDSNTNSFIISDQIENIWMKQGHCF